MESIPSNTTKPPNLRDRVLVHEVKLSRFAKEPKPAFLPRNESCTFPSAALISLSIAFICHGTRTALFLNEKKLELFCRTTAHNLPLQSRSHIPGTCGINSPHGLKRQNSEACAFLDLTLVAAGHGRNQQAPQPIPRLPVRRPIHLHPWLSVLFPHRPPVNPLSWLHAKLQVPRTCCASMLPSSIIDPKQHRTGRTAHDHQRQHYRRPPP